MKLSKDKIGLIVVVAFALTFGWGFSKGQDAKAAQIAKQQAHDAGVVAAYQQGQVGAAPKAPAPTP